jgi:hypothetical protein
MIVNSLCNSCLQPFLLIIEPSEVHLIKEISDELGETCPCPRLCGGSINLVGDPVIKTMTTDRRMKEPMTVTGRQLYQAVLGMGLPDEVPKSMETVDSLLRANKIVKTLIEEHSGKLYLHELHLENGVVLHLASGLKGAQVLKVTRAING